MNTFTLPLVRQDNPRDFLAALGLFRLLSERWPQKQPSLAWENGLPKYTFNEDLPTDCFVILLNDLKTLNELEPSPFRHGDVIKTKRKNYQFSLKSSQDFAAKSDHPLRHLAPKLYATYSSQLTEEKTDDITITAFSFSNGQGGKKLLLDVSQLIEKLPSEALELFASGIAKPQSAKSFRWHPEEYRAGAYRSHDPGVGVRGDCQLDEPILNVLAFFGLTFFTCVPAKPRGATTGITRGKTNRVFRWPIWTIPLEAHSLNILLHQPSLMTGDATACRRIGIHQAWQSVRFSADKSLYFSPASPAF